MENKNMSETLEGGFVESKLSQNEIPCKKIIKEGGPVCLSNLNEECAADVYSSGSEISHGELATKSGNRHIEESMVCDDINNQINKGFLNDYPDRKFSVLTRGDDINNNDVPILERDLNSSLNDGISLNNFPVEKFSVLTCGNDVSNNDVPILRRDLNCSLNDSVLTRGNDINNNDVPIVGGDLNVSGNNGIQIGKVDECVEKCDDTLHPHKLVQGENVDESMKKGDDVLHPHEPSSPTKIEVSGNSINLFVEVFGPLNGNSRSSYNLNGTGKHELAKSDSNQEYSLKENRTISPGAQDVSAKKEGEDIVGEQKCTFDDGDLVWVKTRTQSWWPGMICGPSNVANDMTNSEKRGSFLVKYYGSANLVWCDNSDLKPFPQYFEQMSGQNNSRNFSGSVERALCEIGQRVKSTMTCPCFSKDSRTPDGQWSTRNKEENSISVEKASKVDILSLSQFEPATFYACIKNLACSVRVPGKIELIIVKNRLSSFYCSIGHCELPLQLLRSGGDAAPTAQERVRSEVTDEGLNDISGDGNSVEARVGGLTRTRRKKKNHSDDGELVLGNKTASSSKGWESRERRKSKYLSYPYVDVNKGLNDASASEQEKESLKHSSSLNTTSTPLGNSSGMNSRKRGAKKPLKGSHIVSKADNLNACSAELLAELYSAARDCFYISSSKYSDSLMRFYSNFRIFAFLDADIACADARENQAPNLEKPLLRNSAEAEVQTEGIKVVKKSKKQRANAASVKENGENVAGRKSRKTDDQQTEDRKAKKKKEQVTNSQNQMEGVGVVKESENQKVNLDAVVKSAENAVNNKVLETDYQAQGTVVCRKDKEEKEQVIPACLESVQSSFFMGTNIYPSGSWMINFQQAGSDVPNSRMLPKKDEGIAPGLADVNSIGGLPDLNGNHPSFSAEEIPVKGPSANLAKPSPEQRKEAIFSPNKNGVQQMFFASVSSWKDVPVTLQNTPQSKNGVNGPNQCRIEDFTSGQSGSNVINTGLSSFAQQMGIFASTGKPEPKKRKRKEKKSQVASVIPDLNGNVSDTSLSGKSMPDGSGSHVTPEGEPQKKRRKKSGADSSGPNGEVGGSLLLIFTPGSTLPSKEMLVATFSRYGLLKETEVQDDSSIKIVYERRSDARFAFRSMEKGHTFGESLLSFDTDCMPDPSAIKKKKNLPMLQTYVPLTASKNPTKPGEMPDIAVMRRNVEMMKLTLEKTSTNLSPETRAKLENEIKVFLDKLSTLTGSSSS